MILITCDGGLRNSGLELIRALEIVQNYTLIQPLCKWKFQYGEINVLGNRVDAILILLDDNNKEQQRIGIEVVSSEKDERKAETKLTRLITLGEFNKAYIYYRRLDDVQKETMSRLGFFKEVRL